ncbi:PPR containing protein, putative [Medicago truncatula]|uniref:PPR containing protein, putative n=1 Tax=Medicago truncatula TaxID=3880 RepID=A0A072VJJ8_MEDTR|nr:PPR containing protein, putative [Medicago truncatula]
MENDIYGLNWDRSLVKVVVEKLCLKGYASYAEKMTKNLAKEFLPDEEICDLLIAGYCIDGKIDEART